MKFRYILLGFFFFSFFHLSFSQEKCGSYDGALQHQIHKFPDFYESLKDKDLQLRKEYESKMNSVNRLKSTENKKIIPVVVHIVHDMGPENISDEQIIEAIAALNRNINGQSDKLLDMYQNQYPLTPDIFAARRGDANVEFRLAKIDPDTQATTGIVRVRSELTDVPENRDIVKTVSYWNSYQYLNIWVVRNLPSDAGSTLLGYAQFPWDFPMSTDGVVLLSTEMRDPNSTTLTHELGHWLGLRHIWGDAVCGDDGIKDTPLQRYDNGGASGSAPNPGPLPTPALFPYHVGTQNLGCQADSLNPAGEMFMNYMDYTNDNFCTMFSKGQIEKVHETLSGTDDAFGFREYMCSIENLEFTGTADGYKPDTCSGIKDFGESLGQYTICLGETNRFATTIEYDNATTTYNWSFGDGNTSSDANPMHTYQSDGEYKVSLDLTYQEKIVLQANTLSDFDGLTEGYVIDSVYNSLLEQGTKEELLAMGITNPVLHLDIDSLSLGSYFAHLPVDSMYGEHSSTYFGIDTFLLVLNADYGEELSASDIARLEQCFNTWQKDSIIASQNTATLAWEYDTVTYYYGQYSSDAYDAYFMDTLFYRGNRTEVIYTATLNNTCSAKIEKENFIVVHPSIAPNSSSSYKYSFEDPLSLADWIINSNGDLGDDMPWAFNAGPSTTWAHIDLSIHKDINENDASAADGSSALFIEGGNNSSVGADEIISEAYDLTGLSTPAIKFSYAGAASNIDPLNQLNVYYSPDCGEHWVFLGELTEYQVANAGFYSNSFFPNLDDWDEIVFSKSSLSQSNVFFKFEYVNNGLANNFYIDNIQIGEESDLLSFVNNNNSSRMSVYPNPTVSKATILIKDLQDANVEVTLVNILGKEIATVFQGFVNTDYHEMYLDFSDLERGIYFIKLSENGDVISTDKLLLSK